VRGGQRGAGKGKEERKDVRSLECFSGDVIFCYVGVATFVYSYATKGTPAS